MYVKSFSCSCCNKSRDTMILLVIFFYTRIQFKFFVSLNNCKITFLTTSFAKSEMISNVTKWLNLLLLLF